MPTCCAIAVPYGTLNSRQMRKLAEIARKYDRGYGHFTTRQNLQFNWPALKDTPDILAELASVEMHAIQTSGNCIRNVTADHFAGVAADEIADPRPYAEILRQWSSLHPEFSFLPRKFKIAVNGAPHDRAVIQAHDIGLQIVRNDDGRARLRRLCRRRPRPHAVHRPQGARLPARARPARLYRGDPARLQSRRPARQQVQGAHQDPGAREGPRGAARGGRGGIRRARPQARSTCRTRRSRASRAYLRAARRSSRKKPVERAGRAAQGQGRALRRASSQPTSRRTRRRATPSSPCR